MKKLAKNLERKVSLNKAVKRFSNLMEAQVTYNYSKPIAGVYAFIDEYERQVYFGSTNNLCKRFINHKSSYNKNHSEHPGLHSLFDANGIENTAVEIVFEDTGNEYTKEQLHTLEVLLMHAFDETWHVCSTDSRFKHPGIPGEKHPWFGKFGKDHPTSKPILSFTKEGKFVKEFAGMHEAKRETGIDDGHISACCKGKRNSAGGYRWEYKSKM